MRVNNLPWIWLTRNLWVCSWCNLCHRPSGVHNFPHEKEDSNWVYWSSVFLDANRLLESESESQALGGSCQFFGTSASRATKSSNIGFHSFQCVDKLCDEPLA